MSRMAKVNHKINFTGLNRDWESILSDTSSLPTRDKILRYLLVTCTKSNENCTIRKMALDFNLSLNTIRQNLVLLEKENLVVRSEIKRKNGRPALAFSLHENAFDSFPKMYKEFSLALISQLRVHYGDKETTILLKAVGKMQAKQLMNQMDIDMRDIDSSCDFKQKLERIIVLLKRNQYYPELTEDKKSYLIKNHNCNLYGISKIEPLVCKVCETLMSEIIGKKVTRETSILDNKPNCLFRIEK